MIAGRQTAERGRVGAGRAAQRAARPRADRRPGQRGGRARARLARPHRQPRRRQGAAPRSTSPAPQEGERIVQLTPDQIQVPFGFRVVKITPSLLTLNLERTQRKTVPVRPRVIGRPARGLRGRGGDERPRARCRSPARAAACRRSRAPSPSRSRSRRADRTVTGARQRRARGPAAAARGRQPRAGHRGGARGPGDARASRTSVIVARGRPAQLLPSRVAVVVAGPASAARRRSSRATLQPYVDPARRGRRAGPPRGGGGGRPSVVETRPGVSVAADARPAEVSVRAACCRGGAAVTQSRAAARSLFGTDGIRGVANEHPMTPELALAARPRHHLRRRPRQAATRRASSSARTRGSRGYMFETALAVGHLRDGRARDAVRPGADARGRAPHRRACAPTPAS